MTSLNSSSVEDSKIIFVIYEKGHKDYDETISFVKIHLFGGQDRMWGEVSGMVKFYDVKNEFSKETFQKGKGNPWCYCAVDCYQGSSGSQLSISNERLLFIVVLLWTEVQSGISAADIW